MLRENDTLTHQKVFGSITLNGVHDKLEAGIRPLDCASSKEMLQLELAQEELERLFKGEPLKVEKLRCLNPQSKKRLQRLLLELL